MTVTRKLTKEDIRKADMSTLASVSGLPGGPVILLETAGGEVQVALKAGPAWVLHTLTPVATATPTLLVQLDALTAKNKKHSRALKVAGVSTC